MQVDLEKMGTASLIVRHGFTLINAMLSYSGEILLLTAEDKNSQVLKVPDSEWEWGFPRNIQLFVLRDDVIFDEVSLKNETARFEWCQRVNKDSFLFACTSASTFHQENGRVISDDGTVLGSLRLGPGIADVQVTRRGDIWISYLDVGVSGINKTIAFPGAGAVKLNAKGECLYKYFGIGPESLVETYALNAEDDDQALLYCSPSFDLVRTCDNLSSVIARSPVRGARAIAVDRNYILLVGSYDDPSMCTLLYSDSETTRTVGHYTMAYEGRDLQPEVVRGRGRWLLVVERNSLYKGTVSAFVES